MKQIGQPSSEQGPQSTADSKKRLQEAAARIDLVLRFKNSSLSNEEFAASILKDRHSFKPSPNTLRVWAHVYERTPTVEAFLIDNLRWEEGLLRKDAIAPITLGDDRNVAGLSAEERAKHLLKEKHPLHLSASQLYALRKAYLDGGRTVQALMDCARGGRGGFRGWLANPENQELLNQRERLLIVKSQAQYPMATLLRVNLQRCVGSKRRDEIPSAKALDRFRRSARGIAPDLRESLAKGDRAHDVAFSPKMPTRLAERHGEVIVYDWKDSDVLVKKDGKEIRAKLGTCIDPVSGATRALVVLAHAAGAAETALLIRDAIREKPKAEDPHQILCGLPERTYTDMGNEFLNVAVRASLHDLGIEETHGQGYRPYSRGSIEGNLHKLISIRFEPELPGYVGHEARRRRPDTKAIITFEEYAGLLRHWVFTTFNNLKYQNRYIGGERASRIEIALDNHAPIKMPTGDTLLFALMKRKPVTIQDTGVHFGGLFTYWPRLQADMELFTRLIQERARCELRYDPTDLGVTYLFREGRLLMELSDARAQRAQATEKDKTYFETLRARIRKENRERAHPVREAVASGEDFLEYLEEQRAEAVEMPMAASAGGRNLIRRILPLDHALRGPATRQARSQAPRPKRAGNNDWDPWRNR